MSPITSPIFCVASSNPPTIALVRSAWATALCAIDAECTICREISCPDVESSSAAAATVCTFAVVCCAAAATLVLCRVVSFAIADSDCAERCISVAAEAATATIPPTLFSNSLAIRFMADFRSAKARAVASSRSARRRSASTNRSLKTARLREIWPISLRCSTNGTSTLKSPFARPSMTPQIAPSGRTRPRPRANAAQPRADHPRQSARGDPDGAVEHHRIDIVSIDACLDCEQLVALTIPAGIGELRQLGTTRRFRHLVFEVTAAGAGFANDVLNQQLALIVFVIPAIDIDVFRVGMHIGNAGIGAAGAVDSEIVSGFAPAHCADRIESNLPCFVRRDLAGFGFFLVIRQDLLRGLDQIEHLGPTFLDDGIAKDHHLSG